MCFGSSQDPMGKDSLALQIELKEIVGHLRSLIVSNRDIGFEPPFLSRTALDVLHSDPLPLPQNSLEGLQGYLGDCRRCKLHLGRTNLVFGEGARKARLVFVGEGPGRDEDIQGRPFVGEAGRLLTRIIEAMGLTRESVYICNVVKCRPPHNREPETDEIAACMPFLERQLRLIRPHVICTLGRVAAQGLLRQEFKVTRQRGDWYSYGDIPLMPTYHPAYLLRNPTAKRDVWQDVKKIMERLKLEVKKR
jgi:uracil-DNA glycosylase family 4